MHFLSDPGPGGACCSSLTVSASLAGGIYPELMGSYALVDTDASGRGVYEHRTALTDAFVMWTEDAQAHWQGWQVSEPGI